MFAKIRILIQNTGRSTTMPDGTGTFAVWARNRFLAYDRLNITANGGRHSHTSQRG